MKRILKITAVIALLFIPTYLAVYLYMSAGKEPVSTNAVYAIELCDPAGVKSSFSSENSEQKKFIDFFLKINDSAKSVLSLPDDLKNEKPYTVSYMSYDLKTDYKYYFSKTKPSNSYLVDHNGKAFKIDAKLAIDFLDSKYSAYIYRESAEYPHLTVGQSKVLPSTFEWNYFTYSSVMHSVKAPLADTLQSYQLSFMSVPMSFSRIPENSKITITHENGEPLFEGNITSYTEQLPFLNLIKANKKLNVSVSASWKSSVSNGYEGHAVYNFVIDCIYDPPPMFWLGESAVEEGELVVISGSNIENIDDIKFSSSPEINFTPKFYKDGDKVRAAVAIKMDGKLSSRFVKFTLEYDGQKTELELFVKESTLEIETKKYNYSDKVDISVRNEKNLTEFSEFVLATESSSKLLCSGYFLFNDLGRSRAEFGDTVNNGKEADKFMSNGMAFVTYVNGLVYAVNDGKVAAVGQTAYGGNTVVIDHGLGIRSVYYCIRQLAVEVGDIVKRGDEIGKGSTKVGYTDGSTAYIELWVNDTPVSYAPLLEGGRTSVIVLGDAKDD